MNQNGGIHKGGFAVLCHRNSGSESPGILICALIKNAADEEIEKTSKSGNRFKYQANRTFIVGRVRKYFSRIVLGFEDINIVEKIFREACKCRSQIQPGRRNKRPRIERKRTHFKNRKVTS